MTGDVAPTPEELSSKRPMLTPGAIIAFVIGLALTVVVLWRLQVFAPGPTAGDAARERKLEEFRDAERKRMDAGVSKSIDEAMERIANDPQIRP